MAAIVFGNDNVVNEKKREDQAGLEAADAQDVEALRHTCDALHRSCTYDFDCYAQKCPECGLCFVCRGGQCSCDLC
jgi:hypothetical protein